jgi:chromate transport protein ChrA
MAWCGPEFERVAAALGGIDCAGAAPVVSARSPLDLDNWTMPVLELLMIVGALAALGHAIRSWRRQGDPTGVGLWVATVVQVLILEPPLYFPDQFGLQDRVGLIFVHNLFSVQFLHDRLPLYIVALYPALTYLAYALVRRIGVLERSPAVVWAAAVALVFHCLYEIFDNLGPQLHWWAWNPDAPTNSPWLGSVPLTSAVMFAAASPFGLALATRLLIARPGRFSLRSLGLRTIAVALSGILAMVVFAIPYGLLGEGSSGRSVVLWAELALLAGVAVSGYWSGRRSAVEEDRYPAGAGAVYLVTFIVFWATSLPAYLDAEGGRTSSGAPIGNLAYVLVCSVVAIAVVLLASRPPFRQAAVTGEDPVHHVGRIYPNDR